MPEPVCGTRVATVTFATAAYNTTIDHFSIYKIGFSNPAAAR